MKKNGKDVTINGLSDLQSLLRSREFSEADKEARARDIEEYLLARQGTIISISCKDGILMAGTNPDKEQSIFQVFHRIGLLAVGKRGDCKKIHHLALSAALGKGLEISKADIDIHEIIDNIAVEMGGNFHFDTPRGPYKARFIIVDLGFNLENDVIGSIAFDGSKNIAVMPCRYLSSIIERPMPKQSMIKKLVAVLGEDKKFKKDEKGQILYEEKLVPRIRFEYPIGDALEKIFPLAMTEQNFWSVKEAAFLVGLLIRLLDTNIGKFQMVYLDREMLNKTELGERRFYHIWKMITGPNPYKYSDPWDDWKNFVSDIYQKVKEGTMYPQYKTLVDAFEILEGVNIPEETKQLLEKFGDDYLRNTVIDVLKNM